MKRTALKQKPPKRLPAAEEQMYDWYKDAFGSFDEIGYWIGVRVKDCSVRMLAERIEIGTYLQRHHLIRVGRRRHLRSVLIVLTESTHAWAQSIEPNKGLVLCVLAKCRKMAALGDPAEFDLAEVSLANGGKSVAAEIEALVFEEERWRCWQAECLRRLQEIQS